MEMLIYDEATKKVLVTERQRENALFARDVMWPLVPSENVLRNLSTWRSRKRIDCRTKACFGGWLATHPYFREQGVRPNEDGAPVMPGLEYAGAVSLQLFGSWRLFEARDQGPASPWLTYSSCDCDICRFNRFEDTADEERAVDEPDLSDHAVVTRRLDRLIERSIVDNERAAAAVDRLLADFYRLSLPVPAFRRPVNV